MLYPSVDEFIDIVHTLPLETVVQNYVFEGTPHVFREHPEALEILRRHLNSALSLAEQNIAIVGSAKIGFSLSPHNFPRRFSEQSDIDILVVDKALFDGVWLTMLKWNYPRRFRLDGMDWIWAKSRRGELYWGWFVPDKIRFGGLSFPNVLKPLRDISTMWFNAFRSVSQYPELAGRNVSGRLYRTWDHALLYHVEGLRQIRKSKRD